MSKKIKVALIYGGRSGEHEVSVLSAKSVLGAIDKKKYDVVEIFVNKKGQWQIGFDKELVEGKRAKQIFLPADPTEKELISVKNSGDFPRKVDVIFPVLHGTYGEDGSVQGLFELAGIPYVGAGVSASAVGMDKVLMKEIFEGVGLSITRCLVFLRDQVENNIEEIINRIENEIGYPVFTKPANLGSSVGISKAKNRNELQSGLMVAAEYDRKILVEESIKGAREIEVAVLGNDKPKASVCGEVIPSKEFYDYEDKYILGKTKIIIPAKLSDEVSDQIREMALKAFKSIDCAGMARVDFLVEGKTNKIFISEINTIPGFTSISMYPKLWEASGVSYKNLIDKLITLAIERYSDKSKNKTTYPSKLLTT